MKLVMVDCFVGEWSWCRRLCLPHGTATGCVHGITATATMGGGVGSLWKTLALLLAFSFFLVVFKFLETRILYGRHVATLRYYRLGAAMRFVKLLICLQERGVIKVVNGRFYHTCMKFITPWEYPSIAISQPPPVVVSVAESATTTRSVQIGRHNLRHHDHNEQQTDLPPPKETRP